MSKRGYDLDEDALRYSRPRKAYHSSETVDEEKDLENIAYRDDDEQEEQEEQEVAEGTAAAEEDEIDPLDAFMAGIQEEVKGGAVSATAGSTPAAPKPARQDLEAEEEDEDAVESFLEARRTAGLSLAADALAAGYDSDQEVYAAAKAVDSATLQYDSDDNPIVVRRKDIEALPPVDHSLIDYPPFVRDFYDESPEVSGLPEAEVVAYRASLKIKVSGYDVPRPILKFSQLGLSDALMAALAKQGFRDPTPVQSQALPIVLAGRDVIGVAKTGSGKTLAFLLPLLVHTTSQPPNPEGGPTAIPEKKTKKCPKGPLAVVLAPTRELAQQIHSEAKKISKNIPGFKVVGVFGGSNKTDNFRELKAGCQVVVATPGRLIDVIKGGACSLRHVSFLVVDEADSMLALGFEPQIRSILGQIREDRQSVLFSATLGRRVEGLAREVVGPAAVRVTVGDGGGNEDIKQIVEVLKDEDSKFPWLLENLPGRIDEGEVLIFVKHKTKAEDLEKKLLEASFKVACLHGDKDPAARMQVLRSFRASLSHVLVATDVAARGLDIPALRTVVSYDVAGDVASHVHRIGRTGRAGDKEGVAYTLLAGSGGGNDAKMAGELVGMLVAAGQEVTEALLGLAMKDGKFRAQREGRVGKRGKGRGKTGSGGGGGRGQRGVDFGLGLGFGTAKEPSGTSPFVPTPPPAPPTRPSTNPTAPLGGQRTALQAGMMNKFRSSFVSSSAPSPTINQSQPQSQPQVNSPFSPAALAAASAAAVAKAAVARLSGSLVSHNQSNHNGGYGGFERSSVGGSNGAHGGGSSERKSRWDRSGDRDEGKGQREGGETRGRDSDRSGERRRNTGWDR